MLRLTHLSDWHGQFLKGPLPEADLYICTGDMLPDYPDKDGCTNIQRTKTLQGRFTRYNPFRERLPKATRDAPVIVIRGNHDWINLGPWFDGQVYEIGREATVYEVFGLKFGGFRGISRINGRFSDELDADGGQLTMLELAKTDLHFLVTHAPPLGIRDSISRGRSVERCGLQSLSNYINKQLFGSGSGLIAHFFGHIHEQYGFSMHPIVQPGEVFPVKPIAFSNAATGYLSYEVSVSTTSSIKPTGAMGRLFI